MSADGKPAPAQEASPPELFAQYTQTLENLVRAQGAALDHANRNGGVYPAADVEQKKRLRDEARKRYVDAVNRQGAPKNA